MNKLVYIIGWTLLNSIWQSLLILLILMIFLILINKKYVHIRSVIAYAAILMVFAASIRTFIDLNTNYDFQSQLNTKINSTLFNIFPENIEKLPTFSETSDITFNSIFATTKKYLNENILYVVSIWLFGVFGLLLRLGGGYIYIKKLQSKDLNKVGPKWKTLIEHISQKINLSKSVEIFESGLVRFPTVIGHIKPIILMPIGTLSGLTMNQIELIIAHELAHIKRSDYLLNLFQSFLEIIYFFNPFVWIISKMIREERECDCDDIALKYSDEPDILAQALIAINEQSFKIPVMAISAVGAKNSLFGRIKRMSQRNNYNNMYPKRIILFVSLILILIGLAVVACSTSTDSTIGHNEFQTNHYETQASLLYTNSKQFDDNYNLTNNQNELTKTEKLNSNFGIENDNGRRFFNFHKEQTHWKGTIENGKVTNLYKDGEKISSTNIAEYEKFILTTLDEIDSELADLDINMDEFKTEMHRLQEELKNLHVEIDLDHLKEIGEHFNSEEFRLEMEKLKEEMEGMKFEFNDDWREELKSALQNIKVHKEDLDMFKSEDFKKEMENLKVELDKLKDIKVQIDYNDESFKESMKELRENLKDLKINLKDLDIDLSDMKIDLDNLKIEMRKLKSFMHDLKVDLVTEGYLQEGDDDFDLVLSKESLEVDGKALPENLHKKYLQLYKDHFGKDLNESFRINN